MLFLMEGIFFYIYFQVKEATQHCRNHDLMYEFKQSKVIDEFGMIYTKILIIDKKRELKAEWPIARLEVWLEYIREQDNIDPSNMFNCFDIDWERLSSSFNDSVNESLNSSRISLNITALKGTILKPELPTAHQALDASNLSKKDLIFEKKLKTYASEIQASITKLKDLLKMRENDSQFRFSKRAQVISQSIERFECTLNFLQTSAENDFKVLFAKD